MLCFPSIHELNLKVCLGKLNTDLRFALKNSKVAEPITLEGHSGDCHAKCPCQCKNYFCGCRFQLGLSKRFPWTSECLDVPSNAVCSNRLVCSGSGLYIWKVAVPKMEAGVPQEAAVWGTPGCGINHLVGSGFSAGFDTEKPSSLKNS